MKATLPPEAGPATFSAGPGWSLVQRIADSASFQKSPQLRKLLLHICERALENRSGELREQLIGCEVFERPRDYSPGEDNIVRVQVRRLRKRLEEFFASEGAAEPLVLVIPKGSYVPVFQSREEAPEPLQVGPVVVPAAPAASGRPVRETRLWIIVAVLSVAIVALGTWGWSSYRELAAISTARSSADRGPLWPVLFNGDVQTRIVCADAALVAAQALQGRLMSLDDYVRADYGRGTPAPSGAAGRLLSALPGASWTDLADVRLVESLHRVNDQAWRRISLTTARLTQIDDFTSGNSVLLGSVQSNPWNRLFEQQLNFWIDVDEVNRIAFVRNKAPRPGEAAAYGPAHSPGGESFAFSVIAFLPNLRRNGNVLIIAGTSGQGTQAAGEYITRPESYRALMQRLTRTNRGQLPYFEVLLRSQILGGVAKDAEIVAVRTDPR